MALPLRNEFDEDRYMQLYPDVAAALSVGSIDSGWQHYLQHGFPEGRRWVAKADPLIGVSQEISPQDEMFRGNAVHYFGTGVSALECIESALYAVRQERIGIKRVLDLPCGHGRVMRFLRKAFPAAELTGCDLNRDGVEYCAQTFGAVPVPSQVNPDAIPLLPGFDLIWCGSLLTHLPEKQWAAFLRLFQRVLLPGGIVVFTTHGRLAQRELAAGKPIYGLNEKQMKRVLKDHGKRGFGYVDYVEMPGYGISLSSPSFVLANFIQPSGWRLVSYLEAGWDKRQDVVCLQRML
ncbi:MAG: class I SAM-dependent methyltransferase [Opitutaceae bacterium]